MAKFYLTTAIPYPNAKPHIGFGLEIIQADVVARYRRLLGDEVFFLTGTDEHGTKVWNTAQEEKISPQKLVDQNSKEFARLKEVLNISVDDFIRTSDRKRHWGAVEKIWNLAKKKGDIYKKSYRGLYCIGCEEFKAKRDLINSRCEEHPNQPLEEVSEENYFFKLSRYQDQIKKIIETDELKIIPEKRKHEVLSFINQGLEDFSISRPKSRLPWGIPVPGDPTQTIYVWFDALTNYLSAIDFEKETEKFKKFWPADLHVIGKGVLRFHAIYWPAILFSAKLPLPKAIFVHGYVTVEGQKISKSLGNIIEPEVLIKKYHIDPVRYYLLREIPTFDDGDFSEKHFREIYNGELANNLGNLVSRIAKLCQDSNLGFQKEEPKISDNEFFFYRQKLGDFDLSAALDFVVKVVSSQNKYIDQQKPWELIKNRKKKDETKMVFDHLVEEIRETALLIEPFLPDTAQKIKRQFTGPKIKVESTLFPRL